MRRTYALWSGLIILSCAPSFLAAQVRLGDTLRIELIGGAPYQKGVLVSRDSNSLLLRFLQDTERVFLEVVSRIDVHRGRRRRGMSAIPLGMFLGALPAVALRQLPISSKTRERDGFGLFVYGAVVGTVLGIVAVVYPTDVWERTQYTAGGTLTLLSRDQKLETSGQLRGPVEAVARVGVPAPGDTNKP